MPPTLMCSTGPFWAWDIERSFDAIAEAGFTAIELMVTRDARTHTPTAPGRAAKERGLEIAAIHGPFLVITKDVWGIDPLGKIRRGVELCRSLGAGTLVVHPPYPWERRYAGWLGRARDELAPVDVRVAVETMYPRWVAGRPLQAYRWLNLAKLRAKSPWVTLDTSHLAVSRQDILTGYETLAERLVHIHLSDNAGDGRDGHLELGRGILPIDAFLAKLHSSRYAGSIALELSVSRYLERPRDLVGLLRRSRLRAEEQLAGDASG